MIKRWLGPLKRLGRLDISELNDKNMSEQTHVTNQFLFLKKAKDKERYLCHSIDAETACHLPLFHQQHSSFTCYFGKYHF